MLYTSSWPTMEAVCVNAALLPDSVFPAIRTMMGFFLEAVEQASMKPIRAGALGSPRVVGELLLPPEARP